VETLVAVKKQVGIEVIEPQEESESETNEEEEYLEDPSL